MKTHINGVSPKNVILFFFFFKSRDKRDERGRSEPWLVQPWSCYPGNGANSVYGPCIPPSWHLAPHQHLNENTHTQAHLYWWWPNLGLFIGLIYDGQTNLCIWTRVCLSSPAAVQSKASLSPSLPFPCPFLFSPDVVKPRRGRGHRNFRSFAFWLIREQTVFLKEESVK